MQGLLESPWRAAGIGTALALAVIVPATIGTMDAHGAGALVLRGIHLLAAMVWGGFIVFVNFVQLRALKVVSDAERPTIVRHIAGPSARAFTAAAHATLLTGILLLVPLGAGFIYRPLLIVGVLGGIAMWAIVQFILGPNVARLTGKIAASDAEKGAARAAIGLWARVNLVLLIPVSLAMLYGAHTGL